MMEDLFSTLCADRGFAPREPRAPPALEETETTRDDACTKLRAKCLAGTAQLIFELTYGGYGSDNKRLTLVVYDLNQVTSAKHIGDGSVTIEVRGPPTCYRQKGDSDTYKAKELGKSSSPFEVIADVTGQCRKITVQFETPKVQKAAKAKAIQKVEAFAAALLHTERKRNQQVQRARERVMERRIEREMEEESFRQSFLRLLAPDEDSGSRSESEPAERRRPAKRATKRPAASVVGSGARAPGSSSSKASGAGMPAPKRQRLGRGQGVVFEDPFFQ